MKLRMPVSFVATESEYRANLTGMNTFFGAVLGFVLAGIDRLDVIEFSYVLFIVSGIVISILYVSASKYRLVYALLTLAFIYYLPQVFEPWLDEGESLPEKLQPTLAVWTVMSIFVEFLPRRSDDAATPPT
jgi:hypothetical protein